MRRGDALALARGQALGPLTHFKLEFELHQFIMKTPLRLVAILLAFAAADFSVAQRTTPNTGGQGALVTFDPASPPAVRAAGVQQLVNLSRGATPARRQALIKAAIDSDPTIASSLIEALVEAFPSDSPALTSAVVSNILTNPTLNTAAKSTILTQVAQSAVNTALQIPPTSVPNLVNTVNAVKAALASVGTDTQLQAAVSLYTTPISQLPNPSNPTQTVILNENTETQLIISNDNP